MASEEQQTKEGCLMRWCLQYDNVHTSPEAGIDVLLMLFTINLISKHCCSHIVLIKALWCVCFSPGGKNEKARGQDRV